MNYSNIPDEMKAVPNWVLWKKESRNGKDTKVPYSVNGGRASSTNPDSWVTFPAVVHSLTDQYNGIGFVFTLQVGIIFIDIDHCIIDGEPDERAKDILNTFNTYCEISQSGNGLHVFAFGTIPRSFKNPKNGVEMYAEKRYCAMTGNLFGDVTSISKDQRGIDYVFNKYKTPKQEQTAHVVNSNLSLSDAEIISKAQKNDSKFRNLWIGDWNEYGSHSEADLALCSRLAFWTDGNKSRIDSLFRASGLYRDKWNRNDYRKRTIDQACSCCRLTFTEWIKGKKTEEAYKYERYARAGW